MYLRWLDDEVAKVSMTQDVYFDRNRCYPEAGNRQGY